jgi:hypothetical protein
MALSPDARRASSPHVLTATMLVVFDAHRFGGDDAA